MAYTDVPAKVTGDQVTAGDWNTFLRDNMAALKDLISEVAARQGGSDTDWGWPGTTNYTDPAKSIVEVGHANVVINSGSSEGWVNVVFPQAFSARPLVFATISGASGYAAGGLYSVKSAVSLSNYTGFTLTIQANSTLGFTATVYVQWLAIGPE